MLRPHNGLPLPFQRAIDRFTEWKEQELKSEQDNNAVNATLYHYTDVGGLKGILERGQIWFTDYRHLNDPSELIHGMEMIHDVAIRLANGSAEPVRSFIEVLRDMFRLGIFFDTLEFFIASFSQERDDLGQWRAYADNGRGVAIGFSPALFETKSETRPGALPEFVGPVRYHLDDVCDRPHRALNKAIEVVLEVAAADSSLTSPGALRTAFMQNLAREIIASSLIWNCLTSKHPAYKN